MSRGGSSAATSGSRSTRTTPSSARSGSPREGRPLSEVAQPGETDFRQLAVAPAARGRGIGEALTRKVIALAAERGSHRVVMNSGPQMTGAHALYAKMGFRRLTEREGRWEVEPGRWIELLAFGLDIDPAPATSPTALARLQQESVELIRDLIRIDSVNTGIAETIGDGETRAARFVQQKLAEVGIAAELIESRPGRGSVVARVRGSDPSQGALDRARAPGRRPGGGAGLDAPAVRRRGARRLAVRARRGRHEELRRDDPRGRAALRPRGITPRRDLIFTFLADEEAGGVWGAGWLVDNRPELFAGATEALSEVGGFSIPLTAGRRAYLAATSEKGVAWATLTARGRAGHGSRPTDDNSVVRLAQAVAAVGAHTFPIVRTPALQAFLDEFGAARGLAFSDESLQDDLAQLGFVSSLIGASLRNTATPTVLSAGSKTNIIPGEATARLDIRVLPGQDDALRDGLREVVGDDIDIRWGRWWSATEADVDAPLLAVLQSAIGAEDPDGLVVPYLLPASTDNKHFARLGVAGYGFVPLRVPDGFDVFGQFHSADERIPVESLEFSARVTERILREA